MAFDGCFLDTNVIIRYLIGDSPELAQAARQIIEEEPLLQLSDVVLLETAYTLKTVYQVPREVIVDQLVDFVRRRNVAIYGLDKSVVIEGLNLCRPSGRISFGDALIWAASRSTSSKVIYSFNARFPTVGVEVRQRATTNSDSLANGNGNSER